MTQEKEMHEFLGVACLHCGSPIPVPAIVSAGEGAESSAAKSAVFNLRCPFCRKEKPYRTREIANFHQDMIPSAHPGSNRFPQQSAMSRTAKA